MKKKQFIIFFLFIGFFYSIHSQPNLLSSRTIDLNQYTAYVHHGWHPEYFPDDRNEKKDTHKIWHKIDGVQDGRRMIRMEHIPFEGIKIPNFLSFQSTNPEKYIIYLRFHLKESDLTELKQPALYLTSLGDNWKILINKNKIAELISYSEEKNKILIHHRKRGLLLPFYHEYLKKGENNTVVIYLIAHPESYYAGITMNSEWLIGNYPVLAEKHDETMDLIFMYVYLFTGFYHLLLYVRRPKEKYNLYFSLFSNGLFVYFLTRSNVIFKLINNTLIITVSELSILFLISCFLLSFIDEFLAGRTTLFVKIYGYFVWFLTALTILVSFFTEIERFCSDAVIIWQISMIITLPYLLFRIAKSNYLSILYYLREYRDDKVFIKTIKSFFINLGITPAGNILLGSLILVASIVYDILDASFFHTGITIAKYAFFTMVLGIVVSLTNRFLNVYQQVEELNLNLEKKVKERTKDLNDSLLRVNELKSQQDGDYFLTSLLIDPLNKNFANNKTIKINFYVEEKKKFSFRRWKKELGGDICFAQSIQLKEIPYSFVLNGDAMGKSMQGAGGVLVLGTVIKSIIERTLVSPIEKNLYPEKWLKNVFIELQKVFESFDGSMLISCVIGLINEENGFSYFMNAEHPWTILYRDKKADFIERKMEFHKIGILGIEKQLWIRTFSLKENDVIIAGSDGRDDILTGYTEEGIRIINEDENAILKHVEKGNANLKNIVKEIKKTGELTDDLSLLRIESMIPEKVLLENESSIISKSKLYQKNEEFENALQVLEESFILESTHIYWQAIIKLSLKMKKWKKAYEYGKIFIERYPQYTEYFYYTALAGRNIKKIDHSTELAEVLRLRQPHHVKNLILLADLHRILKNNQRANQIIEEAITIEPLNENVQRLKNMLEELE